MNLHFPDQTRRHFLANAGLCLGSMAFAGLSGRGAKAASPLEPRQPHFAPKAKRVIHLFMAGAPSQLDLFDYKSELTRLEGKPLPASVIGGQRYAFIRSDAAVLGPRFKFAKHGKCGAELSEMLPHLAKIVDDITIVRSLKTDQFNRTPGHPSSSTPAFPSPVGPAADPGSCMVWAPVTESLPAFVVMSTGGTDLSTRNQGNSRTLWLRPQQAVVCPRCLLARRMMERGVRFVNIYHEGWDAHTDVSGNLKTNCAATDRASAALVLLDLKRRGLLDETLVIWGGEFGRTPMVETNAGLGRSLGRDHHPQAFTMWFAGGGFKPGVTCRTTDDLSHVAENPSTFTISKRQSCTSSVWITNG